MKKWLAVILGLVILAFVFADSLFYLAGRWQEKTGRIKRAVRIYSRLMKRYPRSRWVAKAKEAIERLEKSKEKRKRGETTAEGGKFGPSYINVFKEAKGKLKRIEEEKEKEYEKWLEEIDK